MLQHLSDQSWPHAPQSSAQLQRSTAETTSLLARLPDAINCLRRSLDPCSNLTPSFAVALARALRTTPVMACGLDLTHPAASTDAACLWAHPPDHLPVGLVLTVGHQLTAARLRGAQHDSSLLLIAAAIRHLTSGWAIPLHGQPNAIIGAISCQLCAREGSASLRRPTRCLDIFARVRLRCGHGRRSNYAGRRGHWSGLRCGHRCGNG